MNTTNHVATPVTAQKRSYPKKPEKKQPVKLSAITSSDDAIMILNEFMRDARREIRERKNLLMKGTRTEKDYDEIIFFSDSFSLTINFKEGLRI